MPQLWKLIKFLEAVWNHICLSSRLFFPPENDKKCDFLTLQSVQTFFCKRHAFKTKINNDSSEEPLKARNHRRPSALSPSTVDFFHEKSEVFFSLHIFWDGDIFLDCSNVLGWLTHSFDICWRAWKFSAPLLKDNLAVISWSFVIHS